MGVGICNSHGGYDTVVTDAILSAKVTQEPTVRVTVFDTEFKTTDGDFSPWHKDNFLVSAHVKQDDSPTEYMVFNHDDWDGDPTENVERLQHIFDNTDLLVGHNVKIDLQWLWECGFAYTGKVWDTLTVEYILSGHIDSMMSLAKTAIKHGAQPKDDKVKPFFEQGYTANQVPLDILLPYGNQDVDTTYDIYCKQRDILVNTEVGVSSTVTLVNEFCRVLSQMERDGVRIDTQVLAELKESYQQEFVDLTRDLMKYASSVMGDTPINLNSGDDMSALVFSRVPKNKKFWKQKYLGSKDGKTFPINRNQKPADFRRILSTECEIVQRTRAIQCPVCKGEGKVQLMKKDGTPRKNKNNCQKCDTKGVLYQKLPEPAGMLFTPRDASWISEAGFSLSKLNVETLAETAAAKNMQEQWEFFEKYKRRSAIKTYLSNFIEGIERGTRPSGLMHASFMQAVTATGRLSSRAPNLQNMPRGGTFPVKKVFISRWDGGRILDVDFSQLEFRVAGILAQDEQIIADIEAGLDVHRQTASIMHQKAPEDVTKDERTGAKADTFKPLYGGTKGTPRQEAYYTAFLQKYSGVADYHKRLQEEAIANKRITLPTGRFYSFPHAKRTRYGGASQATKIKNYPVQGLATADIVPWAVIKLADALRHGGFKSKLVNTVHDSIIIDVHPDEESTVPQLVHDVLVGFTKFVEEFYSLSLNIPLDFEISMGVNWLEQHPLFEGGEWVSTP